MLFNTYVFFIFLAVVLSVYFLLKGRPRKYFLVIASYIFYGYWNWTFCFLLLLTTVTDYYVGYLIYKAADDKKRKLILLISIVVNLGVLGFFKYFQFFIDSIAPAAAVFGGNLDYLHLNIILPVGISFYTFQSMTYTIDIYRRHLKPAQSLMDFTLYVSFFPQLVAGPIERATHLLPQIENMSKPTKHQVKTGLILISIGLFKKVMIGDTTGKIVDTLFNNPSFYTSDELLAGLILFGIQIYADFSGYSSIARGTARLFGVELMRNFEQPYFSSNVTEFWRRWHISLSTWLKDYLYIPLGGNRKGEGRTYINLMITMLLGGLWHGANWTFVIWGGLHGAYLAGHKFFLRNRRVTPRYHYKDMLGLLKYLGKVFVTLILVYFAWLFFRASSFGDAFLILGKFANWQAGPLALRFFKITLVYALFTFAIDFFEYYTGRHSFLELIKSVPVRYAIMAALLLISLLYMYQSEPQPFIYFQF